MKSKQSRDSNAPKRNLSAYLLYQNAMRDTFKTQHPNMTFGQLSKYTSAMYAELTVEEKEGWQARAEADKTRFLREMAQYVPPPGFDARGEAIAFPKRLPGSKKGRYTRDPAAPKRNLSAYLLYQNSMRDTFKADNPGMTFGQLSKYTSHMYKSLTPDEKAQWEARAHEDKRRYETEMTVYVPPPGHDATGKLIEERPPVKRQKVPKDPNAPKRARGSYVFYTFEMRPKIMSEFPETKFVELGAMMGERWRALTPEQKLKFEEMANEDKLRFTRELEEYNMKKAQEVEMNAANEMSQLVQMQNQQAQQQQLQQQAQQLQQYEASLVQMHHHPVLNAPLEIADTVSSDYANVTHTHGYIDPNQPYYDPTQYHYA